MKRIALVLALAATLALAGCLGGGGSEADAGAASDGADAGSGSGDDPGQTGDSGSGDDAGTSDGHWNATLDEAPPWEPGQWWTVTVTDVNNDETYTVKQVVASQHGSSYDVGLAAEDFSTPVVIAHWPPIGELGTDLTYPIHNEIFKPVQFPLQEGDSWETTYLGTQEVTAEVQSVDGTTAEVEMTSGNTTVVTLTYDAEMETITKLEDFLGLSYEVNDHGHGYEGDVVVPHGKSQYISARVAGAFGLGGPLFGLGPAPPTGSVDVSEPQASAALLAGSVGVGGSPPPPGAYEETVVTPNDESTTLQTTGTNGIEAQYLTVEEAQGTWDFRHVAGGYGIAGTEIVAYEKLVVTLTGDEAAS